MPSLISEEELTQFILDKMFLADSANIQAECFDQVAWKREREPEARRQARLMLAKRDDNSAEQVRELEQKNDAQAKMIDGYCKLISAVKDIGVDLWWEGDTAKAAISFPSSPEQKEHCDE